MTMFKDDPDFVPRVQALRELGFGLAEAKKKVRKEKLLHYLACAEFESTQDAIESLRLVLVDLVENMNV